MSGGWWCAHAEHGARGQREEGGRGLVHVIIVVLVLLFGGGGGYFGRS